MLKYKTSFCGILIILSVIVHAQVPVSQEPRHHMLLSNTHLRLLDVRIPAGDTSQMHIHATPSVFIILDAGKSGSEVLVEEDKTKYPVQHYGNIYFEGFYMQSRIHRVWNEDTAEFHVMDIELPNRKYEKIDSPIMDSSVHFLFDEKPVRAYRVFLRDLSTLTILKRRANILIVRLTNAASLLNVNDKILRKKSDFVYIPAGENISINKKNLGSDELALFELK